MVSRLFSYLLPAFFALTVPGCQHLSHAGQPFVDPSFEIPLVYTADAFLLEKLTVAHAQKDYEAVMESRLDLREQFDGAWPEDDFTLAQNIEDIQEHEHLFEQRVSFTYSVMSLDKKRVLGCIYINPSDTTRHDAQVHAWIRSSEKGSGLEEKLTIAVNEWLTTTWPFEHIQYH